MKGIINLHQKNFIPLKLLFVSLTFLLILQSGAHADNQAPGILLQDYDKGIDFTNQKLILITNSDSPDYAGLKYNDSGWKTVSLPSNWRDFFPENPRVCWYRIHVVFPGELPVQSAGLSLGTISDIDEFYFNGKLVAGTGSFPPGRVSAYDKKRIYEIPTKLIIPGGDNVIALRVMGLFPYENGPHKGIFRIGNYSLMQKKFLTEEMPDIIFIALYLIVSLYFALIFVTRSIDKEYLFFSLFTFFTALYLFLRTQVKYLLFDNFFILKRIEYLALFFIPLFAMEYISHYYGRRNRTLHIIYYIFTGTVATVVIVNPGIPLWNDILFYFVEPSWVIPFGYCFAVSIKEYKNVNDAKYLLIAFIVAWIVFVNDMLFDRGIIGTARLSTYSFIVIIIGTALIMRKRFTRLYATAELYNNRRRGVFSISDENREKLDKSIGYIKENFRDDISREGLAEFSGMHYDYFGKLFKQYTGMKIGDYINELRIEEAADKLITTDMKVIDIAYETGFESLSTFYRAFQNVKKETPTDWQEKHRKK